MAKKRLPLRPKPVPAAPADPLARIRAEIDGIDTELQALLAARARIAQAVGTSKRAQGTAEFYRPEREAEVLRRVIARNQGPLTGFALIPGDDVHVNIAARLNEPVHQRTTAEKFQEIRARRFANHDLSHVPLSGNAHQRLDWIVIHHGDDFATQFVDH